MSRVAVVIPCYKCSGHIREVLSLIGSEVHQIYVVDDKCPEETGRLVSESVEDRRVKVLYHEVNQGVGGAVLTGYLQAKRDGAAVIVKIDGDGQMDPALIPRFIGPILAGQADYTKGNRFWDIEGLRAMPRIRIFGNAALSFFTKLSSGYWDIFDPTNGYTAIHASVLDILHIDKIARRYFFESDMLFRLNLVRAVVLDVPMVSVYGDEVSNLKIKKIFHEFAIRNIGNWMKRIFYSYFLRNFSIASLELMVGITLLAFGAIFGGYHWAGSALSSKNTPSGTVMLAALPVILGVQFLLSFLNFDITSMPRRPIAPDLPQKLGAIESWRPRELDRVE